MPSLTAALAALLAATATALLLTPTVRVDRALSSGVEVTGSVRRLSQRFTAVTGSPSLRRRVLVCAVAGVAVGVLGQRAGGAAALAGWSVFPVVVGVGVVLLGRLEPVTVRRRRERLMLELPEALELLSACLAAGLPLRRATSVVAGACTGPVGDDLKAVLALVNLGASDVEAWRTLRSSQAWRAAVADLSRSVESGTMMVEVLLQHAQDVRERRRAAVEVKAKAVGVRSVLPLMTCFLPAFLLVGIIPTVASAFLHALF